MKFIISRTSVWDYGEWKDIECKEAKRILQPLTYLDYRSVKTLKEAKQERYSHWANDWFKHGENHREEKGMVVRDLIKRDHYRREVEINSLEELIKFKEKYGEIIITTGSYEEYPHQIEIYDGYRE